MSFLFEKLKAYQVALRLAVQVTEVTENPPKGSASLIDQLRRAAASIPGNLAEGSGRSHVNDRKQFFWVARGSANECIPYLVLALERGIITVSQYAKLRDAIEVTAKLITRLIASQ